MNSKYEDEMSLSRNVAIKPIMLWFNNNFLRQTTILTHIHNLKTYLKPHILLQLDFSN